MSYYQGTIYTAYQSNLVYQWALSIITTYWPFYTYATYCYFITIRIRSIITLYRSDWTKYDIEANLFVEFGILSFNIIAIIDSTNWILESNSKLHYYYMYYTHFWRWRRRGWWWYAITFETEDTITIWKANYNIFPQKYKSYEWENVIKNNFIVFVSSLHSFIIIFIVIVQTDIFDITINLCCERIKALP